MQRCRPFFPRGRHPLYEMNFQVGAKKIRQEQFFSCAVKQLGVIFVTKNEKFIKDPPLSLTETALRWAGLLANPALLFLPTFLYRVLFQELV